MQDHDVERRPSAVDISEEDRSVTSDITFQSATGRSIERLLRMTADSNGGIAIRRHTEPHASQPSNRSNEHIDTIIQLKLQVAQQKEMIDCLTSDLNNALSEKRALLSKANQPAKAKPMFTFVSLAEEKAHSDNSRSLHQQYNELQEEMRRLQISMDLQQERMAAVEADYRSLTNERDSLRIEIARMNGKAAESDYLPSSSDLHSREASGSQDFTANLTEFSGFSGSDLIPSSDLTCSSRRASALEQSQNKLAHSSYLPKANRRSSEPVFFHWKRDKPAARDMQFLASPKKDNNWFIGDENEGSLRPEMIHRNEGTEFVEDDMQRQHRRCSMPATMTPTAAMAASSPHSRRRSYINLKSRGSDIVVHKSYRTYMQSEQIPNGGDVIHWGDSDSESNGEIH